MPSGLHFTAGSGGTATISGKPSASAGGVYHVKLKATNSVGSVTQNFTLTVDQAPVITSASSYSLNVGQSANFKITTTGYPVATVSEVGSLPNALVFTAKSNGTATITGSPAVGTGGTYTLDLTATDGQATPATQVLTVTVKQAPAFTSAPTATAKTSSPFNFTVKTSGSPAATITETGTLPSGLHFTAGSGGTATISGKPSASAGGVYHVKLKATNSVGSVTQNFTLTVDQAPVITSASSYSLNVGQSANFKITTTGYPVATVSEVGSLPNALVFTAKSNGTATITGSPAVGTGGTYTLDLTATDGQATPATQVLTVTVKQAPAFTSAPTATAKTSSPFNFTVKTSGSPAATITETGTLPSGLHFTAGSGGTATISGKPSASAGGVYHVKLKATNSVGSVTQNFTLTVDQAPVITSASSYSLNVGQSANFKITTTGYPVATVSEVGSLPNALVFTAKSNGTATITGSPAVGTGGTYTLDLTATDGQATPATQVLTVTVTPK